MSEKILMIHGMWMGGWAWKNFKDFFQKKGYSCITPDLLYHGAQKGKKPHPRLGNTSVLDYAGQMEKLIRKMKTPPVIIGHSMGSIIAQMLAARGLAKAIVLVGPSPSYGIWCIHKISVLRSFRSMLSNKNWWKAPFKTTFKEACYSMMNVMDPAEQRRIYQKFGYESGRAAFEGGFWFLDRYKATLAEASKVTCPVYIMAGQDDRIVPPAVSRGTKRKYRKHSNAIYREYPGHSHMFMFEKGWEKLADDIVKWLKKNV